MNGFFRSGWGMVWRLIRARWDRALVLGLGILVASTSFSLLTADVATSSLRVDKTAAAAFRPAYDLLVSPAGAETGFERSRGLVNDNYLSSTQGGISMAQWHTVLHLPGVSVAAPIANIGYVMMQVYVTVPVTPLLSAHGQQLFRVSESWTADNGLSRYPGGTSYVYYAPDRQFVPYTEDQTAEIVPGQADPVPICSLVGGVFTQPPFISAYNPKPPTGPTDTGARSTLDCFSGRKPFPPLQGNTVGSQLTFNMPVLLSAINPAQEAKLVGLPGTLVSGSYLRDGQGLGPATAREAGSIPVLAASRTYLSEDLHATIQRLAIPPGANLPRILDLNSTSFLQHLTATGPQASWAMTAGQAWQQTLAHHKSVGVGVYWTTAPFAYRVTGKTSLAQQTATNPASVWAVPLYSGPTGTTFFPAPPGNQDTQFARLAMHPGNNEALAGAGPAGYLDLQMQGRFDPARLPGFDPLSKVPLQTYYPPKVTGATTRSRALLGNTPLKPDMNVGGFIAEPPGLLTTLAAAGQMLAPAGRHYSHTDWQAPISSIRVRLSGITGNNPASRARILAAATAIHKATGLSVTITDGSSPTRVTVALPAGNNGRPALQVAEGWVKLHAGLVIGSAVNAKSLALFLLVLVVCALFLGNGAFATVRSRRAELATLSCLGWARRHIFALVLGELAALGLAAGLAGAVLAYGLSAGLGLHLPVWHILLVIPTATALAVIAGLAPAWSATRGTPLDALNPITTGGHRHLRVRGPGSLAAANLARHPARTLAAALGLFIAVAAFAALLGIDAAFAHTVSGTILGIAVAGQVRGVDLIAAVLALALGAASVADVLTANLRERAAETAILAATGWTARLLARVTATEGIIVGAIGAAAGAVAGVAAVGVLTGRPAQVILPAVIAAAAGVMLVAAAVTGPALRAARRPPAPVLAEE